MKFLSDVFDRGGHFSRSMIFSGKNAKSKDGQYGHSLQMYKVPPTESITLEEFEEFAINRLKGKFT